MDDVGVIDQFTETFVNYIDSGFGFLGPDVAFLTTILIGIDITLAGLFWALSDDKSVIPALIKKVLYVGAFAFILNNFSFLANVIFDSFAGLGLRASNSAITADDLMRPGFVANTGFVAADPLLREVEDLLGPIAFFENFVLIAVLMVAWIIVLLAFFILAIQLFITILEFKLTTLAGFILVPFALWGKTAFLAERVLGNVVAAGIKLMVLAVIVGIGSTLFGSFTASFAGDEITIEQALSTVLGALAIFMLGIFGPGIAAGLVSGAPQLGAGAAVGTAVAAGGTLVAGAAGAKMGLAAAGAAARGGAAVAGGASTAYSIGAASGSTTAGKVAGGMTAVGQAGMSAAINPLKKSLGDSYRSGSRAAFTATGGQFSNSPSAMPAPANDGPPAWARRMKRQQSLHHGVATAAHVVRSGDHGGGGTSVSLSEKP